MGLVHLPIFVVGMLNVKKQYSWASLVALVVKNPRAIQETWFRSLGWEDPLEESMAAHSSILVLYAFKFYVNDFILYLPF